MEIYVKQCDWGDARREDIEVLLGNTASHLTRLLRTPLVATIIVVAGPPGQKPQTFRRESPYDPFRIQLSARGKKWSQFAYQFSHEVCHVLVDFEYFQVNRNNWFEEAICELASVFTLRRMSEQWLTIPHWAYYAASLAEYADVGLDCPSHQLPEGIALSDWLSSEEEELRKNSVIRNKNAVVAYNLLPIFESEPAGWNAIRRLPNSSSMFKDYLREWHDLAESVDKPFVKRILSVFD